MYIIPSKMQREAMLALKAFQAKKLQKCYLQWDFNWHFYHILVSGIQS